MWTMLIPAAIALRKSSSLVPEPPWSVRNTDAARLMSAILVMSKRFFVSPRSMLLEHAVHIAHCGSQDVHSGALDKPFGLFWRGKSLRKVARVFVYLGTGADVPDFSLHEDRGIDCFQRFDPLLGLAHIFVEGQGGQIKDDGVKAGYGSLTPSRGSAYDLH
jgi:hypothetical protein